MNRLPATLFTAPILTILLAATPASAAEPAAPAKPNILWLVSEDNDCLLGCYGDALAKTPTFPIGGPSLFDPAQMRIPPYQPDTPEMRADWARYYTRIANLDTQIAAKLKDLADAGLADDTIVFYYSDNGGVLPRSKRFLEESGTHVPLIVYYPPKWRHLAPAAPGSRIKEPVHFLDFAPTVLSLAGVRIPAHARPCVCRRGQGRA